MVRGAFGLTEVATTANTREMTPKELRTRRLAAGWSKQQLASKLGVAVEMIDAWEQGDQAIETAKAIEQVFAHANTQSKTSTHGRRH
jgi:DNA-binding transcriptional regulator YiaG